MCLCAYFFGEIFHVLSFKLLWVSAAGVFDCFLDSCLKVCIICASNSSLYFSHCFKLFFLLCSLLCDLFFAFATVVEGWARLLVTRGLLVSFGFLSEDFVGVSSVSSTVSEKSQMAVKYPFSRFWLLKLTAKFPVMRLHCTSIGLNAFFKSFHVLCLF